jgi:thymidine kinase
MRDTALIQQPYFIVFTGPMFGSKTTKMLAAIERASYQNKKVIAFKPKMDNRYSEGEIVTHTGMKFTARNINSGAEILQKAEDYDVIAVDEAFMIDGVADVLVKLFKKGKSIIVSSIQLSATGQVFEEIRDILPWATKIEICPAVCPRSGADAYYTVRKKEIAKEIEVGGSDIYEPRAWTHTSFMNQELGEENA